MKNSWITFYFEQINKSNIYYVRVSVYNRANWLHSFSQFLFRYWKFSIFQYWKIPKIFKSFPINYSLLSFFLSFFLRIFHKFLEFFFAEENFERFVLTRYEAAAWFFPESDTKSRPMESNRLISYRLMERPISFSRRISYDTAFLRNIPERYSILPTCLLNLFAVIS